DTASLQEASLMADDRPVSPGLFDQDNAVTSDDEGPAEAAASAIAHQMESSGTAQDQDKQNA
ncbi:MAG TPA: hypothetical protein VKM00_08435, partial [Luteimonas sp.]|nr:hypothetical protein [Luteimonas sp.]